STLAVTFAYAAPERFLAQPSERRTDVYSLGCTLHHLLTGQRPFPRGFVVGAVRGAPHVADAAVLAVPDDVMGEKVGAVLFADGAEVDVDAVIAHCREQLADFKVPQYVTVVDQALPRNAGGKLLKAQLREQIRWGAPLR
ncbi:AMP-binding enzyme, partial [Nocardia cyriacigeorgica]|uniref:AMP-binding enzyme n=1 Tax=Nocardia cyriacigeorgica TaxID=135487 RepID=UPI003CC7E1C4